MPACGLLNPTIIDCQEYQYQCNMVNILITTAVTKYQFKVRAQKKYKRFHYFAFYDVLGLKDHFCQLRIYSIFIDISIFSKVLQISINCGNFRL